MTEGLPPVATEEAYDALPRDDPRFARAAALIALRHGCRDAAIARFGDGSLPVFAVGDDLVLKLYPPHEGEHFRTESAVLDAIAGSLPVPTPRPVATGRYDDWSYVLMERLRGRTLAQCWDEIPDGDRTRLAADLGHALRALHAVDVAPLSAINGDWRAFLHLQRARCEERHRALGLPDRWARQIPAFLESVDLEDPRRVLLHTEVMREHLLVERGPSGYRLSGLFDFEPAAIGAPEYELASLGIFVACGDGAFLRAMLLAWGYREAELDAGLQRRALGWALVHRYANLAWYLRRLPPVPDDGSLAGLAARWWPLS